MAGASSVTLPCRPRLPLLLLMPGRHVTPAHPPETRSLVPFAALWRGGQVRSCVAIAKELTFLQGLACNEADFFHTGGNWKKNDKIAKKSHSPHHPFLPLASRPFPPPITSSSSRSTQAHQQLLPVQRKPSKGAPASSRTSRQPEASRARRAHQENVFVTKH